MNEPFYIPPAAVQALLKDAAQRAGYGLQAYIGAEMGLGKVSDDWRQGKQGAVAFPATETTWSKSQKLTTRTGKLYKSFAPNNSNNIFVVDTGDGKLLIKYGTRLIYAGVQENGGFIKSQGRMHLWFWAQYQKTHNEFFKIMALSVKKKGGVTIPARPYFAPGVERFQREGMPLLLKDIAQILYDTINKQQ